MAPRSRKAQSHDINGTGKPTSDKTAHQDKNKTDKNLKLQKKLLQSQSTSVYQGLLIATKCTSLILILLAIAIFVKNWHNSKEEIPIKVTEASILYQYSKIVRECFAAQQALIRALNEEPLEELIKSKLRPIQERVASLRMQTSQYEKLEKIPGGPKNFMTTTLTELNSLRQQMIPLDDEIFKIILDAHDRKAMLSVTGMDALESQSTLTAMYVNDNDNPPVFERLASRGLDLTPREDMLNVFTEDEEVLKDLQEVLNLKKDYEIIHGWSPLDLAELLERTSTLFEYRDSIFAQIEVAYRSVGATNLDEALDDPELYKKWAEDPKYSHLPGEYEGVVDEIEEVIEKFQKHFNQTLVWIREANFMRISMIAMLVRNVKTHQSRETYIELRNVVAIDINRLRNRVENFQFHYRKRQPDPMTHIQI